MYLSGRASPNYNDTKIKNKTKKMKKRFLKELKNSFGFTSSTSKKAGMDRTTYYRWIKEDKKFAQDVADIQGYFDMIVEDKLKMLILSGDGPSIRYYASRRIKEYQPNYNRFNNDIEPKRMMSTIKKINK
jgi:hypothetical protein